MREIKFRAWDKQNKYIAVIFDSVKQEDWFIPSWKDRYAVMQYTELKDKNGVEIYEGDILEYILDGAMGDIGVVTMSDCGFWIVEIKGIEDFDPLCDWLDGNIKILGNIYENPELLSKED